MIKAFENVLNNILKPKYPGIVNIKVTNDEGFGITTYKVYVELNKYEDIYKDKEMADDIKSLLRTLGMRRGELENIVWHRGKSAGVTSLQMNCGYASSPLNLGLRTCLTTVTKFTKDGRPTSRGPCD